MRWNNILRSLRDLNGRSRLGNNKSNTQILYCNRATPGQQDRPLIAGGNPDTVWTTKTDTPPGSPHPPTTASSIVTTFCVMAMRPKYPPSQPTKQRSTWCRPRKRQLHSLGHDNHLCVDLPSRTRSIQNFSYWK